MPRVPHRCRRLATLLVAVAGALVAEAGIKSDRLLAALITRTPSPHLVAEGRQLTHAEAAAAQLPGAQAFRGIGCSMEPLYASNTAIVVQAADYERLRQGMTVVYLKDTGVRVCHTIVGETRGGYLVQGVNNDEEDEELLTPDNFIGVVVQAYAAADTVFRAETEKRLVANGRIRAANRG